MKERNTKQKEIILNAILNTKRHPSIQELSDFVRKENVSIGQATIYRNIAKLADLGMIRKITTKDGIDHYDGDTSPHAHLHCTKCKKLIDIYDDNFEKGINILKRKSNIEINSYELLLTGTCNECLMNSIRKKEN